MFFNLDTGESNSHGSGPVCWMADGNLWIALGCGSISINHLPIEEFCTFLEGALSTQDYVEMPVINGLNIALEDEDEGTRNLCFLQSNLFVDINLQIKHISAFVKFLRDHK
jgi:hypothetical protein